MLPRVSKKRDDKGLVFLYLLGTDAESGPTREISKIKIKALAVAGAVE